MNQFRAIDGVSVLAESFDVFLIDQFGVLHDGLQPYRGAIECLAKLKEHGKNVVLLSNSGKRAAANIARLGHLGFSSHLFDHVVTSGEVAWQGIVDNAFGKPFLPGNSMFLVGHNEYEYGYEQIGMRLVQDPTTADFIMIAASRAPKMSLGQYESVLASAAALDVPALCCNPDRLMLTSEGLQPSAGEIAALYERLGGKVTFVGKPYMAMYEFTRHQTPGYEPARRLAIGDSIEHDIRGGHKAGFSTALVLTGLSFGLNDDELDKRIKHYGTFPDFVMPALRWS